MIVFPLSGSTIKMWTTENTLRLIEDLHSNHALWDVSSLEYKNENIKLKALSDMSRKFGVSMREIEKKIHVLKSQFRREHKKLSDMRKSGASASKCWFGYEAMSFLLPANESRGGRSTDEEHDTDSGEHIQIDAYPVADWPSPTGTLVHETPLQSQGDESQHAEAQYPGQNPMFRLPLPRKKSGKQADEINEALQCMKSLSEVVTARDSSSIFGDFIADALRTSNRPQMEVTLAKQEMAEIVFNLQKGNYAAPATRQVRQNLSTPVHLDTLEAPHSSSRATRADFPASPSNSSEGSGSLVEKGHQGPTLPAKRVKLADELTAQVQK